MGEKCAKLKICANFTVYMSDKMNTESYPLPRIETISSETSGAKHFA